MKSVNFIFHKPANPVVVPEVSRKTSPKATRKPTPKKPSPKRPSAKVFTADMIKEDEIVDYTQTLNKEDFDSLLGFLDDNYHNDEGLISDIIYDQIIAVYKEKYGEYTVV